MPNLGEGSALAPCSNTRCSRPRPHAGGRCLTCQSLLVGSLVRHRYKVRKTVGKGGFGITYLVTDQDCFNEDRILKELCPTSFAQESESMAEDLSMTAERLFKREAKVLLNLQHPGIPKLYAYFNDGDYSYLVQDFIPGRTLSDEIESLNRVFTEQEARVALMEIADILEYLHSAEPPIVHRDIKPQNLMRHENGRLLLIDFGAVCQAVSGQITIQTLIGSPGYAPPEQIFGHPVPQSDLYAAGATILRLITGVHPSQLFNNKTQRMEWETRAKVRSEFAEVLNLLLTQDVNQRLGSATELKRMLLQLPTLHGSEPLQAAPYANKQPSIELETPLETTPNQLHRNTSENLELPTVVFDDVTSSVSVSQQENVLITSPDEIGEIELMPVLFLLRRFHNQRLTGLLTCIKGSQTKSVHFDQGSVVFARSNFTSDRLGEILVNSKRISKFEYDRATELMESEGIRFGEALVKLGFVTTSELTPLIVSQISAIVYSLFDWTAGRYEVRRDFLPQEPIKISISTADLIFEGLRQMSNMDLVKGWLGDFKQKLKITSNPLLLYQAVTLNPKEAFIVSRIDRTTSIEDILSMGGLAEAETLKTICGLLAVGILEWVQEDNTKESEKPEQQDILVSDLVVAPQPLPQNFDIKTAAAFCYEVENMMRTMDTGNYYAILNIDRTATDDQVREAYTQLARKFHPDRHVQLSNYNFSIRRELDKIFSTISEAYRVLSSYNDRVKYDRMFRTTSSKLKIPQIPPDLSTNQPSRQEAPPTRRTLRTEALNTSPLGNQERPSGKFTIQRPPTTPSQISAPSSALATEALKGKANARSWFQKGLEYFQSGQFNNAYRAFHAAANADTKNAQYRIFLARSLALIKGVYTEAEQEFYKAIELDPKNADYYAELGLFYQKLNLFKQADEMFERALELNPNQPIARRSLHSKQ
ncbi:MAG: DnaJ domain-containing protein [Blastocatellia bacterium]|nr:DnaJ domain-containing protein [Blastocatellia bacterium]